MKLIIVILVAYLAVLHTVIAIKVYRESKSLKKTILQKLQGVKSLEDLIRLIRKT